MAVLQLQRGWPAHRRKINTQETWQIYGFDGELLAEYPQNGALSTPQKEYGYRNGQLLITAEGVSGSGGGNSLSLNGSTAYMEAPQSASLDIVGPITLEAWVKLDAGSSGYRTVLRSTLVGESGAGGGYRLTVSDQSKARFDIFQSYSAYTSAIGVTTLSTGVWHHLAGVFNGSQVRVYVDGVLDGSVSLGVTMTSTSRSLLIGRGCTPSQPQPFAGLIDEARVSNAALYTSNFTPPSSLSASGSSKGLWKFDGQTANDSSGNENHGTLNGGAAYSQDNPGGSGGGQNVSWTNAVGVSVSGNNLTKTGSDDWYNARDSSTQSIDSGDGYVEFTASETTTNRMLGLGEFATGYYTYSNIRYAIYLAGSVLYTDEYGSLTNVGSYSSGDTLRVAIENGAVKYYKNGALLRTSTLAPTYPLYVNVAMYSNGSTLNGAVINNGSGAGSSAQIRWLVPDHLGTPRIILDQTGSLANVKRHDYLPFGEELFTLGLRAPSLAYSSSDSIRQQFTRKERDIETGLDYFLARYYSNAQGRFTSPDEFTGGPDELYYFADDASNNPTFYADLRTPQSLNKYQYGYQNPLRYVDPDGHDPLDPPQNPKPVVPVPVPVGPGLPPVPVTISPATPGPTDQQILQLPVTIWQLPDPYLYPISQAIGTAPDPTMDPVPIPPMQAVPLPPPAPIQAGRRPEDFTPADKRKLDATSGGVCEGCGRDVRPIQNKPGVATPADQRQVHHNPPIYKGGKRDAKTAKVYCPACHKEEHKRIRDQDKKGNQGTL